MLPISFVYSIIRPKMLYKKILKPFLFWFNPEAVHDLFVNIGYYLGKTALTRSVIAFFYDYKGPDISKTVDGIKYRTPVLLAAGFDYNARLSAILPKIALGGEEVGSVTARPCSGNAKPRLTRLPRSKSILVNKGLKNDGVDTIINRLRHCRKSDFVQGVSIARTNDEKSCSVDSGIEDYLYSFKRLNQENVGDYYTINISCPNAYGGEAFITPELLVKLLEALKKVKCDKPIYVKMPVNISWQEFDSLLKIIDRFGLNGVIIGNLNKDYNSLDFREEAPKEYLGGLSGKPCAALSTELIRKTRKAYGNRFTIMGVGGIMSPETALEKFEAGADLVQIITGLIFEGPGLVKKICERCAEVRS